VLVVEVSGGFVRGEAFECEYIPVPTYSSLFVEVTDASSIPNHFWTYDYNTKLFSPHKGDVSDPDNEEAVLRAWNNLRNQRNIFLIESDWTVLPDSPLSWAGKKQWKDYRQELRDMPQVNKDINPLFLPLPIKPTFILAPTIRQRCTMLLKALTRKN
jgi:hypothetical protein